MNWTAIRPFQIENIILPWNCNNNKYLSCRHYNLREALILNKKTMYNARFLVEITMKIVDYNYIIICYYIIRLQNSTTNIKNNYINNMIIFLTLKSYYLFIVDN